MGTKEAAGAFSAVLIVVCVLAFLASAAIYFLPVFVAVYRGHPNTLAIATVCILFGWSMIGWGIAMVWSVAAIQRRTATRIQAARSNDPFDFG